jgi:hypothetical protein
MASKGTKMDKRTWGAMVESAVKKAPQKAEAKAIVRERACNLQRR